MAAGKVPTWIVLCAVVVVQAGFGGYGPFVAKFAQQNQANPLVFSFIRDVCCFPVLLLASFVAEKKLVLPTLTEWPLFVLLGFLGMFCGQLMYILGVYWATPNLASAFQPATPVWATFFAIILRAEKLPPYNKLYTWAKFFGLLCAAAGAIGMTVLKGPSSSTSSTTNTTDSPVVTTDCHAEKKSNSHETVIGCVLLIGNTMAASLYIVLQKKYIYMKPESRYVDKPINVTAWSYMWGAILMGAASPLSKFIQESQCGRKADPWHIPLEVTYPIIYAIFIASALCYLLISWATMHISPTLMTAFWPLQVPVTLILSYFVLGEQLTSVQYVFCGLVIIGLMFVVGGNFAQEKQASIETTPLLAGSTQSPERVQSADIVGFDDT